VDEKHFPTSRPKSAELSGTESSADGSDEDHHDGSTDGYNDLKESTDDEGSVASGLGNHQRSFQPASVEKDVSAYNARKVRKNKKHHTRSKSHPGEASEPTNLDSGSLSPTSFNDTNTEGVDSESAPGKSRSALEMPARKTVVEKEIEVTNHTISWLYKIIAKTLTLDYARAREGTQRS
jgi:hypothetical protein